MKIVHVITGMQDAAGTTTFVKNVVRGLQEQGHDVDVAMSPDGLGRCDIIHIHGLWSGLLHKAAQYARHNKIPVVWSTHGMTAPWSMRHKWLKKIPAWLLYQKRDLRRAAAIHCTTNMEVGWNKALGFNKCFIAPLGTEIKPLNTQSTRKNEERVLLFVGRIYPVKGLVNLIKAWQIAGSGWQMAVNGVKWKLRIVGPDQAGHQAELVALVRELGLGESVEFAGPKFGDELSAEYENCDCLTLPSYTENFGATVVDALAHGKPCIASTYTPWAELVERSCGWWADNAPEQLAKAIGEMIAVGDMARREMGERGRKLVEEKYTWGAVVKAMVEGYERVVRE